MRVNEYVHITDHRPAVGNRMYVAFSVAGPRTYAVCFIVTEAGSGKGLAVEADTPSLGHVNPDMPNEILDLHAGTHTVALGLRPDIKKAGVHVHVTASIRLCNVLDRLCEEI